MSRIAIPDGLDTKLCVLGENVLHDVPVVLNELWKGIQPIIVADENTWKAAGAVVNQFMKESGLNPAEPIIYPAVPMMHADYTHINEIVPRLSGKVPIAVGSGTMNDLTKRSAFEADCKGYLCVATACSVDGYTSYGAAITVDGFKKTLPCPAPLAILADSRVLASVPREMTAAGYADLAAKIVAGADWYIADALGVTPIDKKAWSMVQLSLRDWLANPEGLAAGNLANLEALFNGLAATGFAMQYYRESRPASGAEHLFSHIWEMDNLSVNGINPSHGFKVAIGTLISTALMEKAFAWNASDAVDICARAHKVTRAERLAQIDDNLKGSIIYDSVQKVCLDKLLTGDDIAARRRDIVLQWDAMKAHVLRQLFPFEELERRFALLGCPTRPQQIGLDEAEFRRGVIVAAMIRNRYTILDLLFEMGALESILDAIIPKFFN